MAENEKGQDHLHLIPHPFRDRKDVPSRRHLNKGKLLAEDTMAELRRRLTEEVELTLELAEVNEAVVAALQALPFVLDVSVPGNQVVVKTKADQDYRGQVSSTVAQHGGVVLGLTRHEMSLEEAFVTITEKNLSLLTKEGPAA